MEIDSIVALIRLNPDTDAWVTFLVTLGGIQTRLHLIKQEQTVGKLHLVMEMGFKDAKHYLRWLYARIWQTTASVLGWPRRH